MANKETIARRADAAAAEARHPPQLTAPAGVRRIIEEVAAETGVPVTRILGRGQSLEVVRARRAAIRRVHEAHPKLSSTQLGRIFHRDHSTVIVALRGGRRVRDGSGVEA